jgi:hypothetical protein
MSATADAGTSANQHAGLWASFATAVRLIVGWFSVLLAALDLIIEIDRPIGVSDGPYLVFHVVWLVGGMTLVALAWIDPRPGRAGYVAAAAVTVAGTITGAVPATTSVCCMSGFPVRHGYPFIFLARQDAGPWQFGGPHLLADLMFWAFVGLMVLVVVALFRRPPAHSPVAAPEEPGFEEERQYIEHHGHAQEQVDQRTVGPLP